MEKLKRLFSRFEDRALVYAMISGWVSPPTGNIVSSYSMVLGILTSLLLMVITFFVLTTVDYLILESGRKDEKR